MARGQQRHSVQEAKDRQTTEYKLQEKKHIQNSRCMAEVQTRSLNSEDNVSTECVSNLM